MTTKDQEPVAWKFEREGQPRKGWTIDYELIQDIGALIGEDDFAPSHEGIELVLLALEKMYAAPDLLAEKDAEYIAQCTDEEIVDEVLQQV